MWRRPISGLVHEGMQAAVTVDAFRGRSFAGWVGFISPVAEFTPKSVETTELRSSLVYEIRVFVQDPDDELRLGMPATVHLPLTRRDELHERAGAPALVAQQLHKRFRRKDERRCRRSTASRSRRATAN